MPEPIDPDGILDEVIAWSFPQPLQPNEFTVRQFVARIEQTTGKVVSSSSARHQLEKLIAMGKLKKRPIVYDGTPCNAYSYTQSEGIMGRENSE
jgi:hypothetical protein